MRVIAKKALRVFWEEYPDAEEPLTAWYREVEKEDWATPAQIKAKYRSASIVGNNRVVFNIKGNDYRLVVAVDFEKSIVWIKWIGTHKITTRST